MALYPELPQDLDHHHHDNQIHSLLPVCSVCLDEFNEKRPPKYLSCHHTFCEECIHQLVKVGQVECPLCRKVTKVTSKDVLHTNNDILTMAKYGNVFINLWCEDCREAPKPTCTTHRVINKAAPIQPSLAQQVGVAVETWRPSVVRVAETAQGWAVVAAGATYSTFTTVGEYVTPVAISLSQWITQVISSFSGDGQHLTREKLADDKY